MAKLLRPSLPFIILLAACGPAAPQTPADLPTPLVFTTRVPTATIVPTNTAAVAQVSFLQATGMKAQALSLTTPRHGPPIHPG